MLYMTNDDTSVDDSNSVRIMNVPMFLVARQHLSNSSFPNHLVDLLATYNRLDRVSTQITGSFSFTCTVSMATLIYIG